MKYLRLFETRAAYAAEEATLDLPNVSYVEENGEIHFKPNTPGEIYYTTRNGQIGWPMKYDIDDYGDYNYMYYTIGEGKEVFGANIVSNTYENGKGVIKFDGPVTKSGKWGDDDNGVLDSPFTTITLPNTVNAISQYSFMGCRELTSFILPNSVSFIEPYGLASCYSLTSITMSNTLIGIAENAFYGSHLLNITIPVSVTNIGEGAFADCDYLRDFTILGPITTISNGMFYDSESLTSITIPNSVTSIGIEAFASCRSLMNINYNGTKSQWNAIIKEDDWKYNVPVTCKVHCTDGDINI